MAASRRLPVLMAAMRWVVISVAGLAMARPVMAISEITPRTVVKPLALNIFPFAREGIS